MTTVFDVPADLLIKKVAEEFKNNDKINFYRFSFFTVMSFIPKSKGKMYSFATFAFFISDII